MRPLPVLLLAALLAGCQKKQPPAPPQAAQPAAPGAIGQAAPAQSNELSGTVLERVDAPPYSYLRLKTARGEAWAAVPETKAEKGAQVTVFNPMEMDNFESKTLNRKFDVVFFGTLAAPATPAGAAMQHAAVGRGPADAPSVKVEKATGPDARTIAEVYAQKAALREKPVTIRGQVVKFTAQVMGKNWIHLRDGSGDASKGDNDLTVTTLGNAKVGDVLVVKGTVRTNKDFGSGYTYAVIVEEAKIQQ